MGFMLTVLNPQVKATLGWMDKHCSLLSPISSASSLQLMCGAERAYGNWEGTETSDWETDAYLMAEKARAQE